MLRSLFGGSLLRNERQNPKVWETLVLLDSLKMTETIHKRQFNAKYNPLLSANMLEDMENIVEKLKGQC